MEYKKINKKTICDEIDLNKKEHVSYILKLLKNKQKIIFDSELFDEDAIVTSDWRTKLLIKCLEHINGEQY